MAGRESASSRRAAPTPVNRERNGTASGFGRERVIEIQRTRLLAALFEVSAERGSGSIAVAHIVERAGVSRRTFYELFADGEQCFLAGFEEAMARAGRHVLGAYDPQQRWVERVRSSLVALLEFLDMERGAGGLLMVGSLGAGPKVAERRHAVTVQVVAVIDEGRAETKNGAQLPPLTAECIVGGVLSVLHSRLQGDARTPLRDLAGSLMGMIVLPYLGPAVARREFARPLPARRRSAPADAGDPLRDVGMRLTYRTVRVLQSVAANPGSSNRQIGIGAEMEDQGQISKLLARLQRLDLVQNTRSVSARGAPNAWGLTERGWEVQRTIVGQNAWGEDLTRQASRSERMYGRVPAGGS